MKGVFEAVEQISWHTTKLQPACIWIPCQCGVWFWSFCSLCGNVILNVGQFISYHCIVIVQDSGSHHVISESLRQLLLSDSTHPHCSFFFTFFCWFLSFLQSPFCVHLLKILDSAWRKTPLCLSASGLFCQTRWSLSLSIFLQMTWLHSPWHLIRLYRTYTFSLSTHPLLTGVRVGSVDTVCISLLWPWACRHLY